MGHIRLRPQGCCGKVLQLKPRYAAYLVATWLAGIVTNLFSYPGSLTTRETPSSRGRFLSASATRNHGRRIRRLGQRAGRDWQAERLRYLIVRATYA